MTGIQDDSPDLQFRLHPVAGGENDGPVEDAVAEWTGESGPAHVLVEDLPAGGYWLVGTYPVIATESTKVLFCLGDQDVAEYCVPPVNPIAEEPKACGCASTGWDSGAPALLAALALIRRRR